MATFSLVLPAKVEANERIRETQKELGIGDSEKLPFICECDDVHCRTIVQLTRAEYQAVRNAGRTLVVAGHVGPEKVAFHGSGYAAAED